MISRRMLFGGIAAAGLTGCTGGGDGTDASGPITVGLTYIPNVQFCAFYLGVEEGLFGDVDVKIRHHGEQEDLFGALLSDEEQVVFASSDEAVVANKGIVTVATAYQQYPVEIVFREPAESLGDLRGKTLGIPGRFGSSYYAALVALKGAGLTEDDVEILEIGYTLVSGLATGKVDAITGFANNDVVQLESLGEEVWRVPISKEPMLVGPGLMTTEKLADDPRVKAVVEGMLKAEQRAVEDPEAALAATKKQVPALADEEQLATARKVLEATSELWKNDKGDISVDVDKAAMQRMEKFLGEAGLISG